MDVPNLIEGAVIVLVLLLAVTLIIFTIKAVRTSTSTSTSVLPGVVVTVSTTQKATEEDEFSYEFVLISLIMFNQTPMYFMCIVVDEIENEGLRTSILEALRSEKKTLYINDTTTFHEETILAEIQNESAIIDAVQYIEENRHCDGGRFDWIVTIICNNDTTTNVNTDDGYRY